ncbi:hypothetical protein EC973_004405 [Apophysomyces ossiformis]|uniref:Uncharacterized protein n=1 Tax=Apophysomyces ossiformis TaxID=679940 RepID=A0A8H7ERD0_9FUNG|nr:hypothetical protein EC973_004405 [Apophysomyces ossiformis]
MQFLTTIFLVFCILFQNLVFGAPVEQELSIQLPKTNDTLLVGQSAEIAWTSPDNAPINIDIASADNQVQIPIAQEISSGLGSYLWKVPAGLANQSAEWKITIQHGDQLSTSGAFFISTRAPVMLAPSTSVAQAMAGTTATASISIVSSPAGNHDNAASSLSSLTFLSLGVTAALSYHFL